MCDAFLILAQAPGVAHLFFRRKVLPDDTVNAIRIQRPLVTTPTPAWRLNSSDAMVWRVGERAGWRRSRGWAP